MVFFVKRLFLGKSLAYVGLANNWQNWQRSIEFADKDYNKRIKLSGVWGYHPFEFMMGLRQVVDENKKHSLKSLNHVVQVLHYVRQKTREETEAALKSPRIQQKQLVLYIMASNLMMSLVLSYLCGRSRLFGNAYS